jgi:hypothetical protein
MALLIMVMLPMVSSFFSTCGCFFRVERSLSRTISLLLSLACEWPLGRMALCLANGGASSNLRLKDLLCKKKENEPTPEVGPAGRLGPTGPVQSPLRSRGSSCIYELCALLSHHFDDVILASKMEVLLA